MPEIFLKTDMGKLVLVRHAISEYNKKGLWCGWDDPDLAPEGFEQAKHTGETLQDIHIDYAFTAAQKRSRETFAEIRKVFGYNIPTQENKALNERNYGIFTRKNKWEIKKEVGEEEFQKIRRGWNYPIPQGESPKMVSEREIPYFLEHILPLVKEGKNVMFVSSGNALRVIVKYLENIDDESFSKLEIGLGEAWIYTIDKDGKVINKETRAENAKRGKI